MKKAVCTFALSLIGALFLTSCVLESKTYEIKIKITGATVYGNRLDIVATTDHPDYYDAALPFEAPGLNQAVQLDRFHVTGNDAYGRVLVLDGAPAPGGPVSLAMTINKNVPLGHVYHPGGFGENGMTPNTDTYFSFADDQPASAAVPSPIFLTFSNKGGENVSLVSRDTEGYQNFGMPEEGTSQVGHTKTGGTDIYSLPFDARFSMHLDEPIYIRVGVRDYSASDHRPFLTSSGQTFSATTPFESGINFSPGTVVAMDTGRFETEYSTWTEY